MKLGRQQMLQGKGWPYSLAAQQLPLRVLYTGLEEEVGVGASVCVHVRVCSPAPASTLDFLRSSMVTLVMSGVCCYIFMLFLL